MSNEDAIKYCSSRREKTAVYSGKKNAGTVTCMEFFYLVFYTK